MRRIVFIVSLLLAPGLAFAQPQQVCVTIPADATEFLAQSVVEYAGTTGSSAVTAEEYVYDILRRDMRILLGRKHNKEKEQAKQNSVGTLLGDIDSAMP
jgi:hypothetical protein